MMRIQIPAALAGGLLWMLPALAGAAPETSAPPAGTAAPAASAATQKEDARAALRRGRELGKKGAWAGAIRALRTAVSLDPASAAAQSELSWAALQTGDLPAAEQAARQALKLAADGPLRGSAAYNLGRVLEARGDRAGAAAAYQSSVKARRSKAALERLAALDPAAAAALGPVQWAEAAGPIAGGEKQFCQAPPPGPDETGPFTFECKAVKLPPAQLPAPFLEAQLRRMRREQEGTSDRTEQLVLFVRSAQGWFRVELEDGQAQSPREDFELGVLSVKAGTVTGRQPVLLVTASKIYRAGWRHGESEHQASEDLYLIATTANGKLSSSVVPLYRLNADAVTLNSSPNGVTEKDLEARAGRLSASLLPDGTLDVRKVQGQLTEEQQSYVGRQRLLFP